MAEALVACLHRAAWTVLLGLLATTSIHAAEPDITLQLRWKHQFQFAGYYVAKQEGLYEQAGLSVRLIQGGPDAAKPLEALLAGEVDFAIANSGVVIERMRGEPVVALAAIMQTSPNAWLVRADAGIHTPLDLVGKRLMLMPGHESAELLAMLRREGVDLDELELLPTSHDLDDLVEGRVDAYDAYETNEPWQLKRKGIDYHLIKPRAYGVNFYNDVLVAHESLIDQEPAVVDAFLEASLEGWRRALAEPEKTAAMIQANYAPERSLAHLQFEAEGLAELIMPELVALGHMNPGRWQSIAESYVALGFADDPVDLGGFLYESRSATDYTMAYRMAAGGFFLLLLASLLAAHFARLNNRLRREAARRMAVEERLREHQAELFRLANTDALTGLWNRHRFEEVAGREIRRARRYGHPLSVIFMDLDHFKPINDQYGHAAGDDVLRTVAELIRECLRESDSVCRWGGEEFLVLVPHGCPEDAYRLAERIRQRVKDCHDAEGGGITASLGVASLGESEDLHGLLQRADGALYQAKEAGRDRVKVARPVSDS